MFQQNELKRKLRSGDVVYGVWIHTASVTCAELLAHQGFDFLIFDLEHSPAELSDAIGVLRALQSTATSCVIRVPWNDHVLLKKVLDAGFNSIMIPSVDTAEEAEAAVQACRYPPRGCRGYGAPAVRASGYGATADYALRAEEELLLIIQLESGRALRNAEAICSVDGLDVPFIGVSDLAASLGHLERADHADVRNAIRDAEKILKASGKPFGTVPSTGASRAELVQAGYQLIPVTADVALLRSGAKSIIAELQNPQTGGTRAAASSRASSY
jgi:4-hydroxy-2-oxoheptanedioate aldolase